MPLRVETIKRAKSEAVAVYLNEEKFCEITSEALWSNSAVAMILEAFNNRADVSTMCSVIGNSETKTLVCHFKKNDYTIVFENENFYGRGHAKLIGCHGEL